MGMFDYLRCEYPLPIEDAPVDGWQTKDTPAQFMDEYLIDADGVLWGQEYDIVDRSDPTKEGLGRIIGMMTRENIRRVRCDDFTGEVRFYTSRDGNWKNGWIEFSAYFDRGKIARLNQIENT